MKFLFFLSLLILSHYCNAQNVGIGTDTPRLKLHVAGGAQADSLQVRYSTGNSNQPLRVDFVGEIIDQSFEAETSAAILPAGNTAWQSFTAQRTGTLTKIEVLYSQSSPSPPSVVELYAGEGTGGTLLATSSVPFGVSGWVPIVFNQAITSNTVYTFQILNTGVWRGASTNEYPLGRSGSGSIDLAFRTYMSLTTTEAAMLHFNRNGNLGIGTSSPQARLDVRGAIRATNLRLTSGATNGFVLTSDASGNAQWTAPTAINNNWQSSGFDIFNTNFNVGNVGIGTNAPQQRLHLRVNATSNGTNNALLLDNAANGGIGMRFRNPRVNTDLFQILLDSSGLFKIGRDNIGDFLSFDTTGRSIFGRKVGIFRVPDVELDVFSQAEFATIARFSNQAPNGFGQIFVSNGNVTTDLGAGSVGGFTGTNSAGNFSIRTGATTRMFFEHISGRIGIGTLTPTNNLHLQINAVGGGTNNAFLLENTGNGGVGVRFRNPVVTTNLFQMVLDQSGDLKIGRDNIADFLTFSQTGIAHFNNRVGIGINNPATTLHVNGLITSTGPLQIVSDSRYKTNIQPLTNSLSLVSQLRGVSYVMNQTDYPSMQLPSGEQLGFIAQELETILPQLVFTNPDGYKTVAYSGLIPVLVEAVKQLKQEKDREIEELNGKYKSLERKLKQLEEKLGL